MSYHGEWIPRGQRRPGDPRVRVSDAERKDMADTLARHYADGRLDSSEFEERLGRAMAAKTRGDLSGLLDDLPPLDEPPPPRARRRPRLPRLVLAAGLVAATIVLLSASVHVPWLLIILVGWLVWHRRARRYGCAGGWAARRASMRGDWRM